MLATPLSRPERCCGMGLRSHPSLQLMLGASKESSPGHLQGTTDHFNLEAPPCFWHECSIRYAARLSSQISILGQRLLVLVNSCLLTVLLANFLMLLLYPIWSWEWKHSSEDGKLKQFWLPIFGKWMQRIFISKRMCGI